MAKDRDKQQATLFGGAGGGADDKSISFQRAVFIVCNLRRLIKRPKREDKNSFGASAGSRKRSGGGGVATDQRNAAECSLLGPGQDQAALGVDGAVVGHYVGGKLRFRNPIRRAFTLPTILCGSLAGLGSVGPAAGDDEDEQWREFQDQIDTMDDEDDDSNEQERNSPGSSSQAGRSDRLACQQPIKSGETTRGRRRLSPASDCDRDDSLTPLSCLVTPIRKVNPTGNSSDKLMRRADCNQRLQTDCHRNSNLNQLKMMTATAQTEAGLLSCSLRDLSSRPTPAAKTTAALNGAGSATGSNQSAVCCPIWLLAMELLDQNQTQPRDQTRHEQLLGAPSRLGYLLAPTCSERRTTTPSLTRASADSGQSSQTGDEPDQEQKEAAAAANQERSSGSELDSEQMARLRGRGFSNSALCLNDEPAGAGRSRRHKRSKNQSPEKSAKASRAESSKLAAGSKTAQPIITVSGALPAPVEDPIVKLARQRRPSVSNQGSLNVDQQALFSAVECNQLERVKSILDEAKVNVNSLNGDKLTCLDVAVLLRNPAMVRLLQQYNAKESSAYLSAEGRENQLYGLYVEARRLVEDLSRSIGAMAPPSQQDDVAGSSGQCGDGQEQPQLMLATGSLLSSTLFEEKQRQLQYWRRRLDLFMQMRYGFEKLDVPSVPELVVLQVVGENSLGLKIVHSLGQINELFDSISRHQQQSHQHHHCQQQQQQQQQGTRMSQVACWSSNQVRPMSKLIGIAKERRLHCPAGAKCSHWQMDELVIYRQNSDQFQMHDPDDFLLAPGSDEACNRWQQQQQRGGSSAVRMQRDKRWGAALNAQQLHQNRQQQEKLAVFNQLLAQQLAILSQQQQLELLQGARPKAVHFQSNHQNHQHQQQLIYAHQIESTDSAYDNIAAAVASSRQQQQVLVAPESSASAALGAVVGAPLNFHAPSAAAAAAGSGQPLVYHSLAYQLMSARRVNHQNLKFEGLAEGQVAPARLKLQPSSSVRLHNDNNNNNNNCNQQLELTKLTGGNSFQQPACSPFEVVRAGDSDVIQLQAGPSTTTSSTSSTITKYRIEWSLVANFEPIEGSMMVYNTSSYPLECQISNLDNGRLYFVRVASGNHKGLSGFRPATPTCLAPSSWRQVTPPPPIATGNVSTVSSRSNQTLIPATTCAPSGSSFGLRKKFKYDEEVFKKFTKLILLNKHILDESQLNWLQREQQRIRQETQTMGAACGDGSCERGAANKWAANKMANLQNKSSLINMLLLDATMPAGGGGGGGQASSRLPQPDENNNSRPCEGLLPANVISQQLHISVTSSPRGSLYPIATVAADDAPDSTLGAGQSAGVEQAQRQAGEQQQQQQQSSLKVRKNLRNFFQSNSAKFNKLNNQNKRGLYLASVIYHLVPGASSNNQHSTSARQQGKQLPTAQVKLTAASDQQATMANTKLVVTNDDRLPIIEILNDLVAPSSLMADFHWLLKINGTNWIDMKRLRQQLQRSHSSSTLHLRIKLLAAIEQMQLALNLEDIGRLFYKPIQAHDGSIVICTCRSVSDTKQVSNLSIKWTNQHKMIPRHLRKIYDMIAQADKLREHNQEQQARSQQQQQQAPATRNSLACSGQLQPITSQQLGLNKRHSSSTMSGPAWHAAQTPQRTVTGISSDNLQAAATSGLMASEAPPGGAEHPQPPNTRLLYANVGSLPPEINRLCETCQQALVQRRCTMTSASSSSSLASNESQSWSSSQFSINSQQALGSTSRSCTCSRSNSSVATSCYTSNQLKPATANTLGAPQKPAAIYGAQLQGVSPQAISAPSSQRNSTSQASRPASGSVGMVMMMMMGGQAGGQQQAGSTQPPLQPQPQSQQQLHSSGSFSFASTSQQTRDHTTTSSGSVSGSCSSSTGGGRQTQSQQISAGDPLGPHSSSTYLMLASLSLYDLLLFHMREIIDFDQASTAPLRRGLYLGFIQLQTTVESMRLLVPRRRPNMLPCARIRDNAHVSREEWELLKRFASIASVADCQELTSGGLPAAGGARLVVNSSRAGKISVPETVIDASSSSPTNSNESRSSEPAIWGPSRLQSEQQPRHSEQQQQQQLQSDQPIMQQNLLSSHSRTGNSLGFERDRAKSVSPGLICAKAPGFSANSYKSTIERAQMAATASKRQHEQRQQQQQRQRDLLKPSVYSGSCNINQPQGLAATVSDASQAHAHSDTDLPLSLSTSAIPHAGPQRAATASEFGDTRHADDLGRESSIGDQQQQQQHQSSSDSNLVEPAAQQQIAMSSMVTKNSLAINRKRNSVSSISAHQLSQQQSPEMTFVRLIGDAARRLLLELRGQLPKVFDPVRQELVSVLDSLNDEENNRIYHVELIELSNQVTFILLIPSPENVCPVTSNERSNILAHHSEYMLLPLQIFETIHLGTYEPDLLGKYSRLSTILETDLIVAQHDHRQAFSSNELKSTKSRVSHLQDMVAIADEFWRQLRWIVDVVSFARDKSQTGAAGLTPPADGGGSLRLGLIWRHFDRLASYPIGGGSLMAGSSSRGGTSNSFGTLTSRKSVESVVHSVQEADNDSQQDASSSCSLILQERLNPVSKSPLMKTNSSGSTDDTNQAGRSMALRSGQADSSGAQRQELGRTSSVGLDQSRAASCVNTSDQVDEHPAQVARTQRRLPKIELPTNKVTGADETLAGDVSAVAATSSDHDGDAAHEQARGGSSWSPQAERARAPNCDSDSRTADGNGGVHSWQLTGGNRDLVESAGQVFGEQILNIRLSDHDHELVLIDKGERKRFAGNELGAGETDQDQNEGTDNNAAGVCRKRGDNPDERLAAAAAAAAEQQEDEDEDEAAIYAYHISLRDATKAAAKRKSSQQLINLFIDRNSSSSNNNNYNNTEEPANSSSKQAACNNKEELDHDEASTCGGLNVDRRQLELLRLAALAKAKSKVKLQLEDGREGELQLNDDRESLAWNEFYLGLGDVKAYKFKKVSQNFPKGSKLETIPNKPSGSQSDVSTKACRPDDKEDAGEDGFESSGIRPNTELTGQTKRADNQRKVSHLKTTNPFLTDSLDL